MNDVIKRAFDILASLIGLIFLSPVLLFIAILIKISSSGPIFYRGLRVGRNVKLFKIYKFRTMIVDAERLGASSTPEDDPRITRIGKTLRNYKLDELPQLVNVLKGEMSFVGPRPQVKWAVDLYTDEEKKILGVRPGITDYASLRFPDEGKILEGSADPDRDYMEKIHSQKMRLALEYVKNRSLWKDIRIIFETLTLILKH